MVCIFLPGRSFIIPVVIKIIFLFNLFFIVNHINFNTINPSTFNEKPIKMTAENIYLLRWSAILILTGGILFWIGAGWPPYKQWMTADTKEYLSIISSHKTAWYIIHGFFVLGVVVSLLGLQNLSNTLMLLGGNKLLSSILSTGYIVGSVFWLLNIAFRLTVTLWAGQQFATSQQIPESFQTWMDWSNLIFAIYMVLAYVSIACLGFVFKELAIIPAWGSWFCIIFGLSGIIGYMIQFPLFAPPLMIHLPMMILGILILIKIP